MRHIILRAKIDSISRIINPIYFSLRACLLTHQRRIDQSTEAERRRSDSVREWVDGCRAKLVMSP